MPTCGDLAPVLALLEARKEAARMRQWGIVNGRNYMEACTALAEARADLELAEKSRRMAVAEKE